MPIGRYFLYVGSALLALLLVADWLLPPPDAGPARSGVDRATIRIHSSHQWPKAVVIDTTLPTIVPPAVITAAAPEPPPPGKTARDAFAMATEPAPAVKGAGPAKPSRPQGGRAKPARAPAGQDTGHDMFGARNAMIGFRNDFFGPRRTWPTSW